MRPKTYYTKQRIRCPYCQKLFEAEGRSDLSQAAADGIAEQGVYAKLTSHIRKEHKEAKQ